METSNVKTNQGDPTARYSFKALKIGTPQEINDNKYALQKWKINLWNKEDGNVLIATLYGIDKLEVLDNAKRFQQTIDMHDELIKGLEKIATLGDESGHIAVQLLKQAEQK